MIQTPFFFNRGSARLFALEHVPAQPATSAFLMSHAFAEEKLWSHRVMLSLARELAARGHLVLRFDYMGAGDSSGLTQDTSLQSHLEDLQAACDVLMTRHPQLQRVGLIGLRLGASFAALFAEQAAQRHPQVRQAPLILWEPVLDGSAYFQELLRINLGTQLAVYGKVRDNREVLQQRILEGQPVNVDGYEIGRELFQSCAQPDLLTTAAKVHAGPTLVMQIAGSAAAKEREDLKALAQAYPAGHFQRASEQPFWREIKPFYGRAPNLQQATLDWLEQVDV